MSHFELAANQNVKSGYVVTELHCSIGLRNTCWRTYLLFRDAYDGLGDYVAGLCGLRAGHTTGSAGSMVVLTLWCGGSGDCSSGF